jgi:hypothetical protein
LCFGLLLRRWNDRYIGGIGFDRCLVKRIDLSRLSNPSRRRDFPNQSLDRRQSGEGRRALEEQVRQIVLELLQRGHHTTKEERVIPLLHNPPKVCFVTLNRILREIREELNLSTL